MQCNPLFYCKKIRLMESSLNAGEYYKAGIKNPAYQHAGFFTDQ